MNPSNKAAEINGCNGELLKVIQVLRPTLTWREAAKMLSCFGHKVKITLPSMEMQALRACFYPGRNKKESLFHLE